MKRIAVGLCLCSLSACTEPVSADLDEAEANRIVLTLERHGIAADKRIDRSTEGRWSVDVARADSSAAAAVLSEENLPAEGAPSMLTALDEGGLVPSRTAEHARLLLGTAGELERSLRAIDGVVVARVHLAVPRPTSLASGEVPTPTASVLVRHRSGNPPIAATEVQKLVAGAVVGLAPPQVNVVYSVSSATAGRMELAHFGPLSTTKRSLPRLQAAVLAFALVNLLLIGGVVALWSRLRAHRKQEGKSIKAPLGAEP